MKNFVSVSTGAARFQDISLNPQKLAGMCAKLKCCLNYEVDNYMEAGRKLPSKEVVLETADGEYYYFKADILAGLVTYSTDKKIPANLETITAQRAMQVIELNRHGEKPASLHEDGKLREMDKPVDLLENESLTRFDKSKKKRKSKSKGNRQQPKENNAAKEGGNAKPAKPQPNKGNNAKAGNPQPNKGNNAKAGDPQAKDNNAKAGDPQAKNGGQPPKGNNANAGGGHPKKNNAAKRNKPEKNESTQA